VILVLGSILFLIAAFSESILWGLACIFFSPAGFIFLLTHWEEAKNPFFIQLVGVGFIAAGMFVA